MPIAIRLDLLQSERITATVRTPETSGGIVRFCITESMTDPRYYPALARAADELGYDGLMVPDSICCPAEDEKLAALHRYADNVMAKVR